MAHGATRLGTCPHWQSETLVAPPSGQSAPKCGGVGFWQACHANAVLEARCGVPLSGRDIFKCRRGLAHCRACCRFGGGSCVGIICQRKTPSARAVFFGEVALSAELRQVPQAETRLKEAAKLGFEQGFMPKLAKIRASGISTTQPDNLSTLSTCYPGAGHEKNFGL